MEFDDNLAESRQRQEIVQLQKARHEISLLSAEMDQYEFPRDAAKSAYLPQNQHVASPGHLSFKVEFISFSLDQSIYSRDCLTSLEGTTSLIGLL